MFSDYLRYKYKSPKDSSNVTRSHISLQFSNMHILTRPVCICMLTEDQELFSITKEEYCFLFIAQNLRITSMLIKLEKHFQRF